MLALSRFTRLLHLEASQRLPPREGYALWAETYPARPHNPLMEAEQAIVEPMIHAVRPTRALDVGTGTGRCLPLLQAAGARTIVGLDMSLAMLGRTSREVPRICADGCCLPFRDGSFDLDFTYFSCLEAASLRWSKRASEWRRKRPSVES